MRNNIITTNTNGVIEDIIIKRNFRFYNNLTTNKIIENKYEIVQTGIGDILLIYLLINNNLLRCPICINTYIYIGNLYSLNDPIQNFIFKLELLTKLKSNNTIIFYNDPNVKYTDNWQTMLNNNILDYKSLHKYFNFNNIFEEDYIIFHTKCRFTSNFDYNKLKIELRTFYKNFKSKYKIILLGERTINGKGEIEMHKITTIYNELLELKNNNDILDLTKYNIYDNLNFEDYEKDMALIHYAKLNILVGHGGQYCNCFCFGKKTVVYAIPELNLIPNPLVETVYNINLLFNSLSNI
jgi:hypothetical protein